MRKTLIFVVAALAVGGCEVAGPLLLGELTGEDEPTDPAFTSAALSVEVESAEGSVAGTTLSPDMLSTSGDRVGTDLHFFLDAADTQIQVMVPTEDSGTNPYGGGDGRGDFVEPLPAELGTLPQSAAQIMLCSQADCRVADVFDLEVEETADGRRAVFEGSWSAGDSARIALRFTEE